MLIREYPRFQEARPLRVDNSELGIWTKSLKSTLNLTIIPKVVYPDVYT